MLATQDTVIKMAKCRQCGRELDDKTVFCPGCGAKAEGKKPDTAQMFKDQAKNMANEFKSEVMRAADGLRQNYEQNQSGAQPDSGEYIDSASKIVCVLMYLFNILFFIPFLMNPRTRFNMFHANQALLLLILDAVLNLAVRIIRSIIGFIPFFGGIAVGLLSAAVSIFLIVFIFIGIVNVINGTMRPLPIIGRITIIK